MINVVDELATQKGKIGYAAGHFAGKEGITAAMAATAPPTGSAGGNTAAEALISPLIIGVASAVGVIINQIAYSKRLQSIREMYKDEVGAVLGKIPDDVTNKDIALVAKGDPEHGLNANKTIAEELKKLKVSRFVGMLVSVGSMLATVAIVMTLAGPGAAAVPALAADTITGTAAKALTGFAIHQVIEKPMNWAAKKIFNIEKLTTHERIALLERDQNRGKAIGRERVMEVFVSANKELDKFVKDQYGKDYDDLDLIKKRAVTDAISQYIPIKKITDNINTGQVKVAELAFTVENQKSGIKPNAMPAALTVAGKARGLLRNVGARFRNVSKELASPVPQAAQPTMQPTAQVVQTRSIIPERKGVEYDNPVPARSFVERLNAERDAAATQSRTI